MIGAPLFLIGGFFHARRGEGFVIITPKVIVGRQIFFCPLRGVVILFRIGLLLLGVRVVAPKVLHFLPDPGPPGPTRFLSSSHDEAARHARAIFCPAAVDRLAAQRRSQGRSRTSSITTPGCSPHSRWLWRRWFLVGATPLSMGGAGREGCGGWEGVVGVGVWVVLGGPRPRICPSL